MPRPAGSGLKTFEVIAQGLLVRPRSAFKDRATSPGSSIWCPAGRGRGATGAYASMHRNRPISGPAGQLNKRKPPTQDPEFASC